MGLLDNVYNYFGFFKQPEPKPIEKTINEKAEALRKAAQEFLDALKNV